uniref:Odorant receptor n=1 Tax=Semiothisa cinerearia TaxID=2249628 RepID=A0A889XL99_9NEOP|nr:odorant receptor [Semiothisa cinerearia]
MEPTSFDNLKEDYLTTIDFVTSKLSKTFIYPFVGRSKNVIRCYKTICICIAITIFQLTTSLIVSKFEDWFEIINIAPNLGVCVLILVKYTKMHTKNHVYDNFLNHAKVQLWNVVDVKSNKHRKILESNTHLTKHLLFFQYYYMILLIAIVVTFPRIIMFVDTKILGNDIKYLYPFDGWYPFDKVRWYNFIYVWESWMTAIVVSLFVFCDMLHLLLSRHVCMELNILGSTMENLISSQDRKSITKQILAKETHNNIKEKLKTIIKSHQTLVGMVADFEEVLGSGMLLIYIFGSVFICLTILTALMVDDLYMSLRYFCFFISLLVEVFVQCIIGQILIDNSKSLEQAIYFSDWSYADKETRQMLHIFLIRAQRPLKLSAKGYLIMNLNTFGGVCSLSYQFFNLLRTVYT